MRRAWPRWRSWRRRSWLVAVDARSSPGEAGIGQRPVATTPTSSSGYRTVERGSSAARGGLAMASSSLAALYGHGDYGDNVM